MTDCSNVEVRDLLPDLVSGRLLRAEAEMVETHVRGCTDCAAEVELLRTIHALRPAAKPVDVAAIVAALPKPPQKSFSVRRTPARRTSYARLWRMAAALAMVAVGGISWRMISSGGLGIGERSLILDSTVISTALDSSDPLDVARLLAVTEPDEPVTVSFGGLGDYSDEELQFILDQLDRWDGAPSTEPLPSSASPIIPATVGDGK